MARGEFRPDLGLRRGDENDEHYLLYALSEAPRSAFGEIPVPLKTPVFEPTFRGLGPVRLEDVTKDPRYGRSSPFHGLPHGHPPVRSYLAVPVVARTDEVLGGLFFGHGEPGVFSERDERLVVGTATHAAIAIEGTRFHEQGHRAAVALQRALLPADLPEVEGARVAVRYEAASDLVETGGDWYDVGLLPDGRLSLTVGDVMGHDVRAAMRMGQVRNALRAYVFAGNEPAEALRKVDDYMETSGLDHMTTVLHAVSEPAAGRLCAVRSEHLPPAVLLPDGTATWLEHEIPGAPPIGVGLSVSPRAGEVALEAGTLLVMTSDGLLERRGEPIDTSMERLSRELAGCSGLPPDAVCDRLVARVADPHRRDDIALLVLAVEG